MFLAEGYTETSVKKVKYFIEKAETLMDENDTFWLSFQANRTSDIARTDKSFNLHFQTLKEELRRKNFVLPTFSANMRNSQQISSIAVDQGGLGVYYAGNKMNDEIEKLASTVTGEKPSLIIMDKKDVDQELGNALKNVIDKECDTKDTKNLVVLYEGRSFNSNKLEKILKRVTTKTVNVFDPIRLNEKTCENNLINFLSNGNQILVVEQDFFTGCESPHIVCLITDFKGNFSVRCALLRAVAHLTLILTFENSETDPYYLNLNGLKLESKYLRCAKQTKLTFHCDSCDIKRICKSCLYFCHNQHQILINTHRHRIKCECNNSKCCKITSKNVSQNTSKRCLIS